MLTIRRMTTLRRVSGLLLRYEICSLPVTVQLGGASARVMEYRARFCQYPGPGRPSGARVPWAKARLTGRGWYRPCAPAASMGTGERAASEQTSRAQPGWPDAKLRNMADL